MKGQISVQAIGILAQAVVAQVTVAKMVANQNKHRQRARTNLLKLTIDYLKIEIQASTWMVQKTRLLFDELM